MIVFLSAQRGVLVSALHQRPVSTFLSAFEQN
jgi:hypothetical protein